MEQPFGAESSETVKLAQTVETSLNDADFTSAAHSAKVLHSVAQFPVTRLFALYSIIRTAKAQDEQMDPEPVLEELEEVRQMPVQDVDWADYWYLMAWHNIPYVAQYPLDIFYLTYRSSLIRADGLRQDCMVSAVQYGVMVSEHHFMSHVFGDERFKLDKFDDDYYNLKLQFLLNAYQRQGDKLKHLAGDMIRVADTQLKVFDSKQLLKQYDQLVEA